MEIKHETGLYKSGDIYLHKKNTKLKYVLGQSKSKILPVKAMYNYLLSKFIDTNKCSSLVIAFLSLLSLILDFIN